LCGRNAVQVSPTHPGQLVLGELAARFEGAGDVQVNDYLLRLAPFDSPFELTVFRDGRAIIKGTDDVAIARGVYSRYIGS
jgi:molybdopterin-synthase adenylyltransferase